ncbi:neutral zinc metallopeptidase [Deinococcus sp. Marseille-Q6407]|uniref:KPN_02809 family neutral zinc metallopeptidase n=1 Tax=Deinococcus sp. Marseille-Q6407 TaxID=2969223 RepID=UPI0021C23DA2|nr:neutral zinc metallopeptidase [Deinococcus sp. Marseille-Q6407]
MEWRNLPGSGGGFEDRGGGGGGGGGLAIGGIGGLLLMLVAAFFGIDPRIVANSGVVQQQPAQTQTQAQSGGQRDELSDFLDSIAKSTNQVWGDIFSKAGQQYTQPKFARFIGRTQTGCGTGTSGMGPFYCPVDSTVYLDPSFFNEMQQQLGGGGDFAYSYVIAHEVGHHVQNELGIADQVQRQQQRMSEAQANRLSVRTELQADCFAGVWGNHVSDLAKLNQGDVREAVDTASAIGDDTLQSRGRGYVEPDSFTHGTSEQRVKWFMQGFKSGSPDQCDTFNVDYRQL